MKKLIDYFTKQEIILWSVSVLFVILSFAIFDRNNYLILSASLIGVTSLIFNAKANPIGQFLMIIFSLLYGIISFSFSYYGEMITYLGMTMPMAIFALISWLKNPFHGNKAEVKVNNLSKIEWVFMLILSVIVTITFYYILLFFKTANIIPSTLSVTTTFIAVYLTFRRNHNYAIFYAANDIVLILLWTLASFKNISYISVVVCFSAFLSGDIYGFINWKRIEKRQSIVERGKLWAIHYQKQEKWHWQQY